jgi:hypothetical protein
VPEVLRCPAASASCASHPLKMLDKRRYNWVPFLDEQDRLVYIVHRSMLDRILSRKVMTGDAAALDQLTLADVFERRHRVDAR